MHTERSLRNRGPLNPRARRCLGRSRTQLLVGLSLLAVAGTAWIPTPPAQLRVPGSPLAAPGQPGTPATPNPPSASADLRLTRA
jgi:hypothetical protein